MKIPAILGTALVLQLMLSLGLFWNGLEDGDAGTRPLLGFDLARADRIVVDDNLNTAVLERRGEHWVLPGLQDLPGAGSRIDRVLGELAGVETAFPVATTGSAQERFEVAQDKFQRHVQFFAGAELLGELYLGTSPGLRQTHTRRGGEDEIYNLPISSFEFGGDANDWLDKGLLAAGAPTRVEGAEFTLEKQGDAWALAGMAEGGTLDQAQAQELAGALADLRVLRVAEDVPELEWTAFSVEGEAGDFDYRFAADAENNRYYVSRGDRETVFTLSKVDYDRIVKTRGQLLAVGEEETADAEGTEPGVSESSSAETEAAGDASVEANDASSSPPDS